jgi:hypothetical protein
MAQAGAARAITIVVSFLPLLVLATGSTLAHMLRSAAEAVDSLESRGSPDSRPGLPRTPRPRQLPTLDATTANIAIFAIAAHADEREAHLRKVQQYGQSLPEGSYGRRNRDAIAAREARMATGLRAVEQAYRLAIERDIEPAPREPAPTIGRAGQLAPGRSSWSRPFIRHWRLSRFEERVKYCAPCLQWAWTVFGGVWELVRGRGQHGARPPPRRSGCLASRTPAALGPTQDQSRRAISADVHQPCRRRPARRLWLYCRCTKVACVPAAILAC